MTTLNVTVVLSGAPVNGLVDDPEITIKINGGATVVTGAAMTDEGSLGAYSYSFTPVAGTDYKFLIDADPNVTGQVDIRYFDGAFNNELNDIWNDRGLNPSVNKTITENVSQSDYDEAVASPTTIDKTVVKVGAVTTINRS